MKRSLIAILIASIILNGCVGDNASTSQTGSNNAKLAYAKTALIKASGEHHVEKPDYDKRKEEEYNRIKDKIVVDNNVKKPAKQDQKDTIQLLLKKVPTELTQQFNKLGGEIRLINSDDNWAKTLILAGVDENTIVTNKTGSQVNISDAIVYFDPKAKKPTIYVNSNIPYTADANSRKELNYGLINGFIKSQDIRFNKDFVDAVSSYDTVEGIENYEYPELEYISKLDDKDISTEKKQDNQNKMATLFASIMSDYLEYGDNYNNVWPQMADYLKKFEKKFDTIDHDLEEPCPKGAGGCKYTGSNIVDGSLSDEEKKVIQSVHKLIANDIDYSPTAMYENLIFQDRIDKNLVKALNTEIANLIDQKFKDAKSTTSINLEINDSELTEILNNVFLNQGALTPEQKDHIINFIRNNYKFNSIGAKYDYIYKERMKNIEDKTVEEIELLYDFGTKYASLLHEKIMVCDNFAILNYFILKQKDEFKDDLMIPVQIGSGHTVLAVKHKDQKGEDTIYIADSWIPFLNSDEKIKPFFGDLDSYFSYINDKFGNDKSTWHDSKKSAEIKNNIREYINRASNDKSFVLDLFGNKFIFLNNQEQINIILSALIKRNIN